MDLKRSAWPLWGLLLVLLSAGAMRFYHLAGHGLEYHDTFIYSSVAKQWFFDHDFVNPWSKPGFHLLSCLAIALFGYYDHTLLYLSAWSDILVMALMFLIGIRLGWRAGIVLSGVLIYAFLPYIWEESIRGLPHLPSTVFFLAALYVFQVYQDGDKRCPWHLFLVGFLSTVAGSIHPTLFSVSVFFGSAIVLVFRKSLGSMRWAEALQALGTYVAGCVSVIILLGMITGGEAGLWGGLQEMAGVLLNHHQGAVQGHQGHVAAQFMHMFSVLPHILTRPVCALFLVLGCVFIVSKGTRMMRPASGQARGSVIDGCVSGHGLLWVAGLFFLWVNFMTVRAWADRLTVPVVPLMVMGMVFLADRLEREHPRWRVGVLFTVMALAMAGWHVMRYPRLVDKPPTIYRQMANVLAGKVNGNARLLVAPSFFYQHYLETVYFDGGDVYRIKEPGFFHPDQLQRYNIKYIALVKGLSEKQEEKTEYRFLYECLKGVGVKVLYDGERLIIFETPSKPWAGSPSMTKKEYPFFNVTRLFEPVGIKR